MPLDGTSDAADLAEMIGDLECTLVWGGQTVTGTRSEVEKRDEVSEDGVLYEWDAEAVFAVADFDDGTPPGSRARVTLDGSAYWVEASIPDQAGVGVNLRMRRV